jgi:excisionase family DNA binding protein
MRLEDKTKQYYTIKQTADYLSISDKSVRRLVERGLLRPSRALRKLLIPRAELDSFFARTAPSSEFGDNHSTNTPKPNVSKEGSK